jgi:hypothetical protein
VGEVLVDDVVGVDDGAVTGVSAAGDKPDGRGVDELLGCEVG